MSDTKPALDPENTLYLDIRPGRVVIQLLPDIAPMHVAQIKTLVRRGFYDGTPFHRVIEGFMAQGGDPTGTGTGGSDLGDIRGGVLRLGEVRARHLRHGALAKPAQRQQPVLHHVRAGVAPERPVYDLGPGGRRHGRSSTRSSAAAVAAAPCRTRTRSRNSASRRTTRRSGGDPPLALDPRCGLAFKAPRRTSCTGEPVAQVVEHETFNLGVVGSSPTGLTI